MQKEDFYLPTLSHWEYGNPWSGDLGAARYMVRSDGKQLSAELWRGPLSREFSEPLFTGEFPVSEDGLVHLRAWLCQSAQKLEEGSNDGASL